MSRLTAETDPPSAGPNPLALENEDRRRPGQEHLRPDQFDLPASRDQSSQEVQEMGRFTVSTDPARARVLLWGTGVVEEYRDGMELPAGDYWLEVSAERYQTHRAKVQHGTGRRSCEWI